MPRWNSIAMPFLLCFVFDNFKWMAHFSFVERILLCFSFYANHLHWQFFLYFRLLTITICHDKQIRNSHLFLFIDSHCEFDGNKNKRNESFKIGSDCNKLSFRLGKGFGFLTYKRRSKKTDTNELRSLSIHNLWLDVSHFSFFSHLLRLNDLSISKSDTSQIIQRRCIRLLSTSVWEQEWDRERECEQGTRIVCK